jgi:hypothetical protein
MTTTTLHPVAATYMEDLRHAGRRLPRSAMRDLLAEIEAHLAETTDQEMSDADVLTVLDRLGDPKDIIAAQQPEPPVPSRSRGIHEWAAIVLLLFGGFIFGFGWLAGLVLLWSSPLWTTRDKWIGTLVVPGGLASALVALAFEGLTIEGHSQSCVVLRGHAERCTGGPSTGGQILGVAVIAVFVLGPFATSVYLARRAR